MDAHIFLLRKLQSQNDLRNDSHVSSRFNSNHLRNERPPLDKVAVAKLMKSAGRPMVLEVETINAEGKKNTLGDHEWGLFAVLDDGSGVEFSYKKLKWPGS